ncbi:MAG TPA: hypothetical protein VI794_01275 [Patescibacteria group bacterium]|nr:hypothetical protein [Patescibacteria group bacterium]
MVQNDIESYSPKESEREKRRDKKRQPRMEISGRSVLGLAQIIANRAKGGAKLPKRKRK